MDLISESIRVETASPTGGVRDPVAFTWRGRRYEVRKLLTVWTDAGFGAGEVTRTWYRWRHRNYYRVEADDGEVYELYLDRSGSRRDWVLARRL